MEYIETVAVSQNLPLKMKSDKVLPHVTKSTSSSRNSELTSLSKLSLKWSYGNFNL